MIEAKMPMHALRTGMHVRLGQETITAHSGHLNKVSEEMALGQNEDLNIPDALRFCLICFTNRCGSNYLADVLSSSRQMNLASEVYNWDMVLRVAKEHQFNSFRQYFAGMARAQAIGNVVAVKVALDHLVLLEAAGILREIADRSEFILVERSDKLSQAISLSIASQTQQWASFMQTAADVEPAYDHTRIKQLMRGLIAQMRRFDEFFAWNGLGATYVNYEQMVENPEFFAKYIGRKLGLADFQVDLTAVRTQKQAGPRNARWREMFLTDSALAEAP